MNASKVSPLLQSLCRKIECPNRAVIKGSPFTYCKKSDQDTSYMVTCPLGLTTESLNV